MADDFRFRWLDMVLRAQITDSAKAVGTYLFARAGGDHTCFPSMTAIAEGCRRSRHTSQRAIAQLHATGLIGIALRGGPMCQDGRNRVTLYTLQGVPVVEPRASGGVPPVEPLDHQGVPNGTLRGAKSDHQGVPVVEPGIDHRTNHKEQTKTTKGAKPSKPRKRTPDLTSLFFVSPIVFCGRAIPEAFLHAWSDWVAHRKEIRKPLSERAAKMGLKKCKELGYGRAIKAIEHSVGSGYQGIFEPGGRGSGNQPTRLGREEAPDGEYPD